MEGETSLKGFKIDEYFYITPVIRYKKKQIDLSNGTAKEEYRLQQMWQGSNGTEKWEWVEYVD